MSKKKAKTIKSFRRMEALNIIEKDTAAYIKVMVDGKIWDSGKRKLGTFIGDYAKTGINTSILPGRCLDPNTRTQAGEVVKNNILNPSYS